MRRSPSGSGSPRGAWGGALPAVPEDGPHDRKRRAPSARPSIASARPSVASATQVIENPLLARKRASRLPDTGTSPPDAPPTGGSSTAQVDVSPSATPSPAPAPSRSAVDGYLELPPVQTSAAAPAARVSSFRSTASGGTPSSGQAPGTLLARLSITSQHSPIDLAASEPATRSSRGSVGHTRHPFLPDSDSVGSTPLALPWAKSSPPLSPAGGDQTLSLHPTRARRSLPSDGATDLPPARRAVSSVPSAGGTSGRPVLSPGTLPASGEAPARGTFGHGPSKAARALRKGVSARRVSMAGARRVNGGWALSGDERSASDAER